MVDNFILHLFIYLSKPLLFSKTVELAHMNVFLYSKVFTFWMLSQTVKIAPRCPFTL